MKFFWSARTRSSRIAWMLEELGLDHERVTIDIDDPAKKDDPDFRAASPMGKVPALADGEVRLCESAAICLYLADRYSAGDLAPALDDAERGAFLYWMFFTPAVLEPAMAEKVGGWKPNPRSHGWGDFPSMIRTLEERIEPGPWLLGEHFTAADVMVGSSCVQLRMFGMLPESKILEAYADRCLARPAYVKALSLEPQ
jgi:glutathione S-transferase